jgi:hypothetical protein
MMLQALADICLMGAGVILGRAIQRHIDAAKKKLGKPEPQESSMVVHTDELTGHVHFKGVILASDFHDAMNTMSVSERKYVAMKHTEMLHIMTALLAIFKHLPRREKK